MPLYVKREEIASDTVKTQYTQMSTQMVYGDESSLMLATRPGGYHSRPHKHDTEQMNYVVDGEIWVFVEDQFFLVKAGDFYRVPRNAVHWGWITSDKPCTILEVFAPTYLSGSHPNAAALYADGETRQPVKDIKTESVSDEYRKVEEKLPIKKK
jgi:quercetin dioxygenase-like cupin family protein